MKRLTTAEIPSFLKAYRFAGGKLRRLRVRYGPGDQLSLELLLVVRPALKNLGTEPKPAKLHLKLDGVEEFRFAKRPSVTAGKIPDARFGYFDGLMFLTLDAWSLLPGDVPRALDFRASDAYAAGRELWWQDVTKPA